MHAFQLRLSKKELKIIHVHFVLILSIAPFFYPVQWFKFPRFNLHCIIILINVIGINTLYREYRFNHSLFGTQRARLSS